MARQFTDTYLPRPSRRGQRFIHLFSPIIGTGGTTVTASATTTVSIDSPPERGWIESLSIRGNTAAISASGTVLVTVYKRDVANSADVALNTAFSIEAAGLTALDATINVPLLTSLTNAQRTKLEADTFFARIVSDAAIGTAPIGVQVCLTLAQTR
jgi:hypothetical protein